MFLLGFKVRRVRPFMAVLKETSGHSWHVVMWVWGLVTCGMLCTNTKSIVKMESQNIWVCHDESTGSLAILNMEPTWKGVTRYVCVACLRLCHGVNTLHNTFVGIIGQLVCWWSMRIKNGSCDIQLPCHLHLNCSKSWTSFVSCISGAKTMNYSKGTFFF